MDKPTIEDEKELMSINDNDVTVVSIPHSKKIFKVRWIKPYTCERITKLTLRLEKNKSVAKKISGDGDGQYSPKEISELSKFSSQLASLCLLNGLRIFLFHWIYWRWLYYVNGYDYKQLSHIIEAAKKKIPQGALFVNTVLGVQMKITNMTMTKEEVNLIQAGLSKG